MKSLKTLEELFALKAEALKSSNLGEDTTTTRVVVGMATCGISAGATPVYEAMVEQVSKKAPDIMVSKTGCIGICCMEPIVEVHEPGKEKVTYVFMTPEKVEKIVDQHLLKNQVVEEYTIGAKE